MEKWLLQVQDVMLISIRDVIEKARDVSNIIISLRSPYIHVCISPDGECIPKIYNLHFHHLLVVLYVIYAVTTKFKTLLLEYM